MVGFIDIHCHLDRFISSIDHVMDEARKAGVSIIVTNGIDANSNKITLELSKSYPEVKAALGIYPPDTTHEEFDIPLFEQELKNIEKNKNNIFAIGEIGMDGKYCKDKNLQKYVFTEQVALAKELDKPIIVHSRKAEEEILTILEKMQAKKVIMHCFSGKKKLIKKGIELGYSFSIPTSIVKATQFQELVKLVPLDQLFAETDSPYLSPYPALQNKPAFVVESYKKIAEIKEMTLEEVKNAFFMNYQRMC